MEELHYATVAFGSDGAPIYEKPCDPAVIYDEVKPSGPEPRPLTGSRSSAPLRPLQRPLLLRALTAGLAVVCLTLVSVLVALTVHFRVAVSEQRRMQSDLTERIERLQEVQVRLERQAGELSRERDRLNLTLGAILEYQTFPVASWCPHRVCQPCPLGWLHFQSMCYLFTTSTYSSGWRTWEESRDECRELAADLVTINSREEQEFITNNTEFYNTDKHGYWIGYRATEDTWQWTDGSNGTVTFWIQHQRVWYSESCALAQGLGSLDNWRKTSCSMRNRWICEMRTLIK